MAMSSSNNNNRRVTFGGCDHVDASEIHSLSDSQVSSLWYDQNDMTRFQTETKTLLRHRERFDADEDSWRGLESGLNKNLYFSRKRSIRSIIQLQEDNRANGVEDLSAGMASLAMELNRDSVNRAIMLAAKDMRDARSIHHRDSLLFGSKEISYSTSARVSSGSASSSHQKRKPAAARTA